MISKFVIQNVKRQTVYMNLNSLYMNLNLNVHSLKFARCYVTLRMTMLTANQNATVQDAFFNETPLSFLFGLALQDWLFHFQTQ